MKAQYHTFSRLEKKMLKLFLINQSTEETSEKTLIQTAQQGFSSLSL